MREKTHAHRRLVDDVPEAVKQRRLREVIETFNAGARASNAAEVGRRHLVMLEGPSKKSADEWMGRTDTNKRVVVRRAAVGEWAGGGDREAAAAAAAARDMEPGDMVAVRITEAISANTLRAEPLARCSIARYAQLEREGRLPHL